MSIKSNYSNINNLNDKLYGETHHRSNHKNLLNNNLYIDTVQNNLNINTANYIDNEKLCSLKSTKQGNISGNSLNNFTKVNYKQDYISKMSDTSFISQFVPFDNYYINKNNNKNNNSKKSEVLGFEYDNFSKLDEYDDNKVDLTNINRLNTIQNNNFYDKYCYNKYQNLFNST